MNDLAEKSRRQALPIWFAATLSQVAGLAIAALGAIAFREVSGEGPELWMSALFAGFIAAIAGQIVFRLPIWWLAINMAFLPALWLASGHGAGWAYGLLFSLSLLVFWNAARDRVPLYLTNSIAARSVAEVITHRSKGDSTERRFLDLGSGPGGFCLTVAERLPDWQVTGLESSPLLALFAMARKTIGGANNLTFHRRNLWDENLGSYDAVYAFLSPAPMARLYDKVRREMKPGSIFVSNSFDVPGVEPDEVIDVNDSRLTRLLVWRL